jgi:hypothetical protein
VERRQNTSKDPLYSISAPPFAPPGTLVLPGGHGAYQRALKPSFEFLLKNGGAAVPPVIMEESRKNGKKEVL